MGTCGGLRSACWMGGAGPCPVEPAAHCRRTHRRGQGQMPSGGRCAVDCSSQARVLGSEKEGPEAVLPLLSALSAEWPTPLSTCFPGVWRSVKDSRGKLCRGPYPPVSPSGISRPGHQEVQPAWCGGAGPRVRDSELEHRQDPWIVFL